MTYVLMTILVITPHHARKPQLHASSQAERPNTQKKVAVISAQLHTFRAQKLHGGGNNTCTIMMILSLLKALRSRPRFKPYLNRA
jgi:hypothetical protein